MFYNTAFALCRKVVLNSLSQLISKALEITICVCSKKNIMHSNGPKYNSFVSSAERFIHDARENYTFHYLCAHFMWNKFREEFVENLEE